MYIEHVQHKVTSAMHLPLKLVSLYPTPSFLLAINALFLGKAV